MLCKFVEGEIVFEGAEAKIIKLNSTTLRKVRCVKTYRNELLDRQIRVFRTKREVKVLKFLEKNNLCAPKVVSENYDCCSFDMEFVEGESLKNCCTQKSLFRAFSQIIQIHNLDIIHGDLTALNVLVKNSKVCLIDFGLAEFSKDIEKKAVDLHTFFRCIRSECEMSLALKERLVALYRKDAVNGARIISQLKKVEMRGRNRGKKIDLF